MAGLTLTKPLLFIDTETTGKDPATARIVSLAIMPIVPPGYPAIEKFTTLVNPQMPIPAEATEIHGISDAMVKNAPVFKALGPKLAGLLCVDNDLAGYNVVNFDFPLITNEFARCGLLNVFPHKNSRIVDPHRIFYNREQRTLQAAVRKYCGRDPVDSHECEVDAFEAYNVLMGQMLAYPDLNNATVDDLVKASKGEHELDIQGKLRKNKAGFLVFNFGKHLGVRVIDQPDYVDWMLKGDFLPDTKDILRQEMQLNRMVKQGPWTKEEEQMLSSSFQVGLSADDLAKKLKRDIADVRSKLAQLGLS
jgi:DNA polymerase-3 subunit epsilon